MLEVFHTERNAGQQARVVAPRDGFVDPRRGGMSEVGVQVHERVQALVALGDATEVLVEDLDRFALPFSYGLRQLDDGRIIRPRCRHGCKP